MTDIPSREYFERVISDEHRWTVARLDSLKSTIEEGDKRTQLALTEARRAVDKAEQAIEGRLALLNEFRSQSADEQKRFVTVDAFSALKEIVDKQTGKAAGIASVIAIAVAVISVVVSLIGT